MCSGSSPRHSPTKSGPLCRHGLAQALSWGVAAAWSHWTGRDRLAHGRVPRGGGKARRDDEPTERGRACGDVPEPASSLPASLLSPCQPMASTQQGLCALTPPDTPSPPRCSPHISPGLTRGWDVCGCSLERTKRRWPLKPTQTPAASRAGGLGGGAG
jgi:hypothetical protein